MFRALSTRKNRRGYEQLGHNDLSSTTHDNYFAPYLRKAKSLHAERLTSASKAPPEEIKMASKIHPFFSIFDTKRKKKATAKPEFSRYLEYLKEGGVWDVKANNFP